MGRSVKPIDLPDCDLLVDVVLITENWLNIRFTQISFNTIRISSHSTPKSIHHSSIILSSIQLHLMRYNIQMLHSISIKLALFFIPVPCYIYFCCFPIMFFFVYGKSDQLSFYGTFLLVVPLPSRSPFIKCMDWATLPFLLMNLHYLPILMCISMKI